MTRVVGGDSGAQRQYSSAPLYIGCSTATLAMPLTPIPSWIALRTVTDIADPKGVVFGEFVMAGLRRAVVRLAGRFPQDRPVRRGRAFAA